MSTASPSSPEETESGPMDDLAFPSSLVAFVDESMRRVDGQTKCYYMAAAVLPYDLCPVIRDVLRPLARRSVRRVHWRDEEEAAKELIVHTIVAAGVESIVVVGDMIEHRKEERARHQVLKNLLYQLDQRHVSHALLESRFPERDRADITSVGRFRNGRYLSARLGVAHGQPLQEPLLWLPDAVAGAAGDHRCGLNRTYELMVDLVTHTDLGPI